MLGGHGVLGGEAEDRRVFFLVVEIRVAELGRVNSIFGDKALIFIYILIYLDVCKGRGRRIAYKNYFWWGVVEEWGRVARMDGNNFLFWV